MGKNAGAGLFEKIKRKDKSLIAKFGNKENCK